MFQQKYRDQIALKEIRTEPCTFQGSILKNVIHIAKHFFKVDQQLPKWGDSAVDLLSDALPWRETANGSSSRYLNGSLGELSFTFLILGWRSCRLKKIRV